MLSSSSSLDDEEALILLVLLPSEEDDSLKRGPELGILGVRCSILRLGLKSPLQKI